jgi:hypothetical protein
MESNGEMRWDQMVQESDIDTMGEMKMWKFVRKRSDELS